MVNEDKAVAPTQGPTLKASLWVLFAGVIVAAVYQLLDAFDVGGIGDPADIGGGLIWLAGLVLIFVGLVMLALNRWRARG